MKNDLAEATPIARDFIDKLGFDFVDIESARCELNKAYIHFNVSKNQMHFMIWATVEENNVKLVIDSSKSQYNNMRNKMIEKVIDNFHWAEYIGTKTIPEIRDSLKKEMGIK